MLNIPETVKALFKADGIRKNFRVQFPNGELPDITNDNIVQESVKFTESLCSQDVLKFGLTEASVIEFETVGVANMYGMTIEAGIEIDLSSLSAEELAEIAAGSWDGVYVSETDTDVGFPFFRVPYGVFQINSCPRNHEVMTHRRVTAYSLTYSGLSAVIPDFPTIMPFERFQVTPDAILSQVTREDLTPVSKTAINQASSPLYNSAGTAYNLVPVIGTAYIRGANGSADYVETDLEWDETACRAVGNDVADQLANLGFDLTYNAAGDKIFTDNREAIENTYPALFGPAIICPAWAKGTTATTVFLGYWYHIKAGALYPLLNGQFTGSAFYIPDGAAAIAKQPGLLYYHTPSQTPTVYLRPVGSSSNAATITLSVPVPALDPSAEINYWKYPTAYGIANQPRLSIENKGTERKQTVRESKTIPFYSFLQAYDKTAVVNSAAELRAYFGKAKRDGNFEFIHISQADPIAISPGHYSVFWWDEYEVQPIGSVRFSYGGNNETLKYQFGQGLSVYDMTDNEVLSGTVYPSAEHITQTLDEFFVPYVDGVNFVPIDLEAKGLPYLEAGDFLIVSAEDETTARSYIMRQEISGVQVLTARIESTSGSIIESEVTE